MRFISVAARPIPAGPCGGGCGVSYRLMAANEKYHLFDDTIYIFNDKCLKFLYDEDPVVPEGPVDKINQLEQFYRRLDEVCKFQEDDYFVFHDLESFYAMKTCLPWLRHTLVVYHQQGSLYSEHLAFGKPADERYEKYCLELTRFGILESSLFAFPSRGAKQALLDTLPEIETYLAGKREIILYNGCSPTLSSGSSALDGLNEILSRVKGDIFVTVATLNEAKAVDRLPAFFRNYGQYVEDYFWIVVGSGAKRNELAKGLEDLAGHVLWLDGWVDNADIIRLYEMADYYILAHRLSIFDYSTIEAMHMGCVPILTPVGGNLEMITEENGYFLDESLSGKGFVEWKKGRDISKLKEQNRRIAGERFSELSMLKAYHDLVMAQ